MTLWDKNVCWLRLVLHVMGVDGCEEQRKAAVVCVLGTDSNILGGHTDHKNEDGVNHVYLS